MSERNGNTGAQKTQRAIDPFDPAEHNLGIMTGDEVAKPQEDGKMVPPVKLLVFDMGHVFVRFDWDKVCQGFCEHAKVSRERFKTVLVEVSKMGYESGKCNTEQFLGRLNELLDCNISVDQFTVLWNATFEEDPQMAELLQQLGRTYPLYLLSNTNENHYAHLQGRFNVSRHFAHLILSYEVALAKARFPHLRIGPGTQRFRAVGDGFCRRPDTECGGSQRRRSPHHSLRRHRRPEAAPQRYGRCNRKLKCCLRGKANPCLRRQWIPRFAAVNRRS